MSQPEALMDIDDLARTLKRPKSWVYDNYRPLGIPYVKVGQAVRFKPSAVATWIDAQAQGEPLPVRTRR